MHTPRHSTRKPSSDTYLSREEGLSCGPVATSRWLVVVTAGACSLVTGCFGDPAPDPEVAPLEVIARPDSCYLNRDSVAEGIHPVSVIVARGAGRVRILLDDQAVYQQASGSSPSGDAADPEVELAEGEYVVECVVEGAVTSTSLKVTAPSSGGGGY